MHPAAGVEQKHTEPRADASPSTDAPSALLKRAGKQERLTARTLSAQGGISSGNEITFQEASISHTAPMPQPRSQPPGCSGQRIAALHWQACQRAAGTDPGPRPLPSRGAPTPVSRPPVLTAYSTPSILSSTSM